MLEIMQFTKKLQRMVIHLRPKVAYHIQNIICSPQPNTEQVHGTQRMKNP